MPTSQYIEYGLGGSGGGGITTYANLAAFPVSASTGTLGLALDTGIIYEWNGAAWAAVAGPGVILGLGTPTNGLGVTSGLLHLALATSSTPGAVANIGAA